MTAKYTSYTVEAFDQCLTRSAHLFIHWRGHVNRRGSVLKSVCEPWNNVDNVDGICMFASAFAWHLHGVDDTQSKTSVAMAVS